MLLHEFCLQTCVFWLKSGPGVGLSYRLKATVITPTDNLEQVAFYRVETQVTRIVKFASHKNFLVFLQMNFSSEASWETKNRHSSQRPGAPSGLNRICFDLCVARLIATLKFCWITFAESLGFLFLTQFGESHLRGIELKALLDCVFWFGVLVILWFHWWLRGLLAFYLISHINSLEDETWY